MLFRSEFPIVIICTPVPPAVAIFTVLFDADAPIPIVPVPASNVKEEVLFVLPNVTVCAAAPLAMLTVLADADVPIAIVPVPASKVNCEAPFVLPIEMTAFPVPVADVAMLTVCVFPVAVCALPMEIVLEAVD